MVKCKIFSRSLTNVECQNCYRFENIPLPHQKLLFLKDPIFDLRWDKYFERKRERGRERKRTAIYINYWNHTGSQYRQELSGQVYQGCAHPWFHIASENIFMTKTFRRGHLQQYRQNNFKTFSIGAIQHCTFVCLWIMQILDHTWSAFPCLTSL